MSRWASSDRPSMARNRPWKHTTRDRMTGEDGHRSSSCVQDPGQVRPGCHPSSRHPDGRCRCPARAGRRRARGRSPPPASARRSSGSSGPRGGTRSRSRAARRTAEAARPQLRIAPLPARRSGRIGGREARIGHQLRIQREHPGVQLAELVAEPLRQRPRPTEMPRSSSGGAANQPTRSPSSIRSRASTVGSWRSDGARV